MPSRAKPELVDFSRWARAVSFFWQKCRSSSNCEATISRRGLICSSDSTSEILLRNSSTLATVGFKIVSLADMLKPSRSTVFQAFSTLSVTEATFSFDIVRCSDKSFSNLSHLRSTTLARSTTEEMPLAASSRARAIFASTPSKQTSKFFVKLAMWLSRLATSSRTARHTSSPRRFKLSSLTRFCCANDNSNSVTDACNFSVSANSCENLSSAALPCVSHVSMRRSSRFDSSCCFVRCSALRCSSASSACSTACSLRSISARSCERPARSSSRLWCTDSICDLS
mmetsp:Transcript_112645/g.325473  ORF Transcript_112645/g.325473 Transcript_112645/m.325473 type:complete len:284 (-) Transcript_112645:736-1587(-)